MTNETKKLREELRSIKQDVMARADLPRLLAEHARKTHPDWWRKVCPRLYSDTFGFGSTKIVAGYLTYAMEHMREMAPAALPTAYKLLQPVLWHMVARRMPWLFVAPALAEAVKRTTFPDEIDWSELKLPYECGGLILPKGTLVHPKDGDCAALFWGRLTPGDIDPPLPGFPSWFLANKAFSIIGLCTASGMWYDSNLTDHKRPVVKLNNLFYTEGGVMVPFAKDEFTELIDEDLNETDDRQFVEQMGILVFGTFLALSARPELLERERLERTVKDRKRGGTREFWSPNVIGRSYRLPAHRPDLGGTHSSPRLHWRRGHFRQQPYGPARAERKTIWLEPQLIGAE